MPRLAVSPTPRRSIGVVVPFRLAVENLDLSHPLSEAAVHHVAEQLLGAYGIDALTLTTRYADVVFEKGDPVRFSDWCRLAEVIEFIQLKKKSGQRRRV